MKTDSILSVIFDNAQSAHNMSKKIGISPYRSYLSRKGTFVIQYDLKYFFEKKHKLSLIDYIETAGADGPQLLIDISVFFDQKTMSKRIRVLKKVMLFSIETGARIEFSVYKTQN